MRIMIASSNRAQGSHHRRAGHREGSVRDLDMALLLGAQSLRNAQLPPDLLLRISASLTYILAGVFDNRHEFGIAAKQQSLQIRLGNPQERRDGCPVIREDHEIVRRLFSVM